MTFTRFFALGAAALAAFSFMDWRGTLPAEASCSGSLGGPKVALSAASGKPGDVVTVTGRDFLSVVCYDSGFPLPGRKPPKPKPAAEIKIELEQGAGTSELASVKANKKGEFSVKVKVPAKSQAGPSAIAVRYAFEVNGAVQFRSNWFLRQSFEITGAPGR
jgi:hypothetical protein